MRVLAIMAALLLVSAVSARAQTYNVFLNGFEQNDGAGGFGLGDPDGTGSGTVTINTITDTITWNIVYANIAAPTDAHIHIGGFGTNGGVVVPFGTGNTSGNPNTISGSIIDSDGDLIVANPNGYYVNIHNGAFPGGAIRGQIPEPSAMTLLLAPAVFAIRRSRTCARRLG
jgi:hypothetical protein